MTLAPAAARPDAPAQASISPPAGAAPVAIVGAGLIGRAFAIVLARAGHEVRAWDADPGALARLPGDLAAMLDQIGADPTIAGRVHTADSLEAALDGAALVQENGPERLELKQALFAQMDAVAGPDTILASSSSALVASRFTQGLAGAGRCLIAHPVNPPHVIPVVELCPSPATDPAVMDRAEAIYAGAGMVPVRLTREIDGFVLNRLQAAVLAEACRLVAEGVCTVQGLDDTMKHGLGRRWALMGPLETIALNAPDGVPDYMRRYGPMLARLADDCARGEAFDDRAAQVIAAAFPDVATPEAVRGRSGWRDAELAALDTHLRNRAAKDR